MRYRPANSRQTNPFLGARIDPLACVVLCFTLLASSWPVRALAATAELTSSPERFLLRHADALGLPEFVRVGLQNQARGARTGARPTPPTAAGFAARLRAPAGRIDPCAD